MKKILNLVRLFDVRRVLGIAGLTGMLTLLFLGPAMLRASERSTEPTTATTTATVAPTKPIGSSNGKGAVDGMSHTPSTTSSVGHVGSTITPISVVTDDSADPCTAAASAINQIQNSYIVPNQQLQDEITSSKNTLIEISKATAAAGGVVIPEQQAIINEVNPLYQLDTNKLQANMREMNQQLAPYKKLLIDNACV